MSINYPNSPSNGDTLIIGNVTYTYNNAKARWEGGAGGSSVDVQEAAPGSPSEGDMWFQSSTRIFHIYDGTSWQLIAFAQDPTLTTVSPATFGGISGQSFTLTGNNFDPGTTVKFIDAQGGETSAGTTTYQSVTSITATTSVNYTVSQGPLDVKISTGAGKTATFLDKIQTGVSPIWTTAAGNLQVNADASADQYFLSGDVNEQVVATDTDAGTTITYSLLTGSLPAGVTLNTASGALTGTAPSSLSGDTTYTFTIQATDGINTASREFSIKIKNQTGALYDFTSHTFTNASGSLRTGPTQAQMRSAYSSQSWAQTYVSQGVEIINYGL